MLWFISCTASNFVVGTLFLLSYDRESLLKLVQVSPLGSIALTVGILLGLVTLGAGVLSVQAERQKPLLITTVVTLLLTLMSIAAVERSDADYPDSGQFFEWLSGLNRNGE